MKGQPLRLRQCAALIREGANGAISGAPTAVDSYQFTITATDSSATPNSGSQSYTLAENCTYVGY